MNKKEKMDSMVKRILVVDDEPDIIKMVGYRLKVNGYEVIPAYDGQEALELTRKEKPDLLILDLMLPKLDGYKVCQTLKSDEEFKDIPVVILTGRSEMMDIKEGMALADSYVTKPFKFELLLGIVRGLLGE